MLPSQVARKWSPPRLRAFAHEIIRSFALAASTRRSPRIRSTIFHHDKISNDLTEMAVCLHLPAIKAKRDQKAKTRQTHNAYGPSPVQCRSTSYTRDIETFALCGDLTTCPAMIFKWTPSVRCTNLDQCAANAYGRSANDADL